VILRRQALDWLRADLALYAKRVGLDASQKRAVRERLTHWRQDADRASVRDTQALDKLTAATHQEWRRLWEDVAATLKKVENTK
jgi:hypothetical protein